MSTDTEAALEDAIRAHALATGIIDDDEIIVGWAVIGSARNGTDDGARIMNITNEGLDPFLHLGMVTTIQADALRWCASPGDDEP